MDALKDAVQEYAQRHANGDGLALTPVPGFRMMRKEVPDEALHSTYRPLVCLVLQGAKHLTVGVQQQVFRAGQSAIVGADMPVIGRVIKASAKQPYLAVAIELDLAILREVSSHSAAPAEPPREALRTLFLHNTDEAALDCAMRLMRLVNQPKAVPLLHDGIKRELHYWLLSGPQGSALRDLALPDSYAGRLTRAIDILREQYRVRVPVERLAEAAAMSPTAFHKHFKAMTSLTPGQFQKRLRLIEARRLILDTGSSATRAGFEVGYESISQFTREYTRMFAISPGRDRTRRELPPQGALSEQMHHPVRTRS